jgi:diacylglycerol O-acyltransferase / wax synthase
VGHDPSRRAEQPFWLDAQRLLEAYPAVPLNPGQSGPHHRVLSYDGGVHFGLLADRDLDPPLGAVRTALEDAMDGRFAPPDRG